MHPTPLPSADSRALVRGALFNAATLVCASGLTLPTAAQVADSARAAQAPAPAASAPGASTAVPGSVAAAAAAAPADTQRITISATRRREPAREVPLTINIIDADALERGSIQQLRDLVSLLPGVNYSQAGVTSGQSQLSMRGVAAGAQFGPTVSVYVDDVPVGSSSAFASGGSLALDLGMFDLQQVEVLRGPQGTLYGAGSMGGLLKYVSADASSRMQQRQIGAEVSATQGGGSQYVARAALNLPLAPGVAGMRASVYRRTDAGYIRDVARGIKGVDAASTSGGRVSFTLTPTPTTSVRLTALTQRQDADGSSTADTDIVSGQPVDGRYTKRLFIDEPVKRKLDWLSAAVEHDLKWARFNSITAYQKSAIDAAADPSPLFVPLLTGAGIVADGYTVPFTARTEKWTQEFRLTSRSAKPFEYLAGLFYTKETSGRTQALYALGANRQRLPIDLLQASFPSSYEEVAAYGNGTYYLRDDIDLTAGLRLARNRQVSGQTTSGLLGLPEAPTASASESVDTWLLAARYRITPTQAVYLRAASGYRPGGPQPVYSNPVTGEPLTKGTFSADTLVSYELGWKAELYERKVSVELAGYHIDWRDLQVATTTAGFSGIGNAGRAVSRGIEASFSARPDDQWRLGASLSLIDATLREDSPDLGALAGERLPDTARVSASMTVDHLFAWSGRESYVGLSLRHVGDRLNGFSADPSQPQYRMPAFTTIDLRAGTTIGATTLGVYVRNLTNAYGQTGAVTGLSGFGGPARVNLIAPRTVGVQLSLEL